MEISEDKTKIRRSPNKPLPEVTDEYKNDVKNRSVYIVSEPLMHLIISYMYLDRTCSRVGRNKGLGVIALPLIYMFLGSVLKH